MGAPAGERTALYRLYDAKDRLLYVGITCEPRVRFKDHAAEKTWWGQVSTREIEWFDSRAEAEVAEIATIRREQPLRNLARYRTMYLHPMARQHFGDQPFTRHDLVEQLRLHHGTVSAYLPRLTAKGSFRRIGEEAGSRRALFVAVEVSVAADASPFDGPLPSLTGGELEEIIGARVPCLTTFSRLLHRYRVARGMSLADLAKQVGFHRGFIHRVETGERYAKRRLVEAVDIALQANGELVNAFTADEAAASEQTATDLREALAALAALRGA